MDVTPVAELPKLLPRAHAGHKGTYGKVLVVAGSRGMSGGAVLCAHAALRSGAGVVQLACPAEVQSIVAAAYPGYTTIGLRQHADGTFGDGVVEELVEVARGADVLAVGPGMGRESGTVAFVRRLLDETKETPVVLDADGLFAVSPFSDEVRRQAPFVLTPHPAEFARLTGSAGPKTDVERAEQSVAFARTFGCVLLLKGSGTLVTDGSRLYRNATGNPGMGTGGSGDVLAGVIAALMGQGMSAFDAAVLGAWAHGRAGDRGAMTLGQTALTATDLIDYLPAAFRELEARW
jgi:NAD(P)H-hydrate epimerase